jgi:hypothetical protein
MRAIRPSGVTAALIASAVWLVACVAPAETDGAGLFALPAERGAAFVAARHPARRASASRRIVGEVRSLLPLLDRLRSYGVEPLFPAGGFGFRVTKKL